MIHVPESAVVGSTTRFAQITCLFPMTISILEDYGV